MQIRTVVTLEQAAEDLDTGKAFYDAREEGVGLYFFDSLLSDIESPSHRLVMACCTMRLELIRQ